MRLRLTCNPQGWYTISRLSLVRKRVKGTRRNGLYLRPGEPMDQEHICPDSVFALFGIRLEPFQSVEIEANMRVTGPVTTVEKEPK